MLIKLMRQDMILFMLPGSMVFPDLPDFHESLALVLKLECRGTKLVVLLIVKQELSMTCSSITHHRRTHQYPTSVSIYNDI